MDNKNKLLEIISNITMININEITESSNLKCDLMMDSFTYVQLMSEIEDDFLFGVTIDDWTLNEESTVSDLLNIINKNSNEL